MSNNDRTIAIHLTQQDLQTIGMALATCACDDNFDEPFKGDCFELYNALTHPATGCVITDEDHSFEQLEFTK